MVRRIGTGLLLVIGLIAGVGYRLATKAPPSAADIAARQCIDNVANEAGENDEGDAIEAQVAACNMAVSA